VVTGPAGAERVVSADDGGGGPPRRLLTSVSLERATEVVLAALEQPLPTR
jgi:hypothetical protein